MNLDSLDNDSMYNTRESLLFEVGVYLVFFFRLCVIIQEEIQ